MRSSKHRLLCFFLIATAYSLPLSGIAQDTNNTVRPEVAEKVVSQWKRLPVATHFEKWTYDMWAFNSMLCLRASGLPLPLDLAKFKPHFAGSHSLAQNVPAMCSALVQGPKPVCYSLNSQQPPFAMPSMGLPKDYSFLTQDNLPDGTSVTVGGYCQLVMNAQDTQQFYVGPANFRWTQPLAMRSLQTSTGARTVKMGNAVFESSAPGVHPVIVIAVPPNK